jgi:phenylacetate-CoA ligase
MNPYLNPVTSLPFLKSYIFDPGRLRRLNSKQLKKYQDKVFRKIVKYAYSVPMYHKKYKKAGVHPSDISGVKDSHKLPLIHKKDFVDSFPDGVIPEGYNKNNGLVLSTSGSTGKPVSFYVDFPTLSKGVLLHPRLFKAFNFNWRKSSFVSIGNFSKGKADQVFEEGIISKARRFMGKDTFLGINAFDDMKVIIKKLDDYCPDVMMSYPVTFQQLAYFKKKGYGENINPKLIIVSGYTFDEYTKNYVKDVFNCKVVDMYSSAESCSYIGFECKENKYHINSDFYYLEAVNENMEVVAPGESGHVVMTRLFGKGTPFVRYTGMDDWVTISPDYDCSCGFCSDIFLKGIEGRRSTNIVLPNGKIYPAASFAIVSLVLKDLKTYKVAQFQIIQKKIDEIEILLVIDDALRDKGPSVDLIFKKIKEAYVKMVGPEVKITVKEVDTIKSEPGKPLPLVVSHIKLEDGLKRLEKKSF